jgi:hypothetical protein
MTLTVVLAAQPPCNKKLDSSPILIQLFGVSLLLLTAEIRQKCWLIATLSERSVVYLASCNIVKLAYNAH